MMFFDSHIHTEFSTDSQMKAQDALKQAERLGLGLVFTEHFDAGLMTEKGEMAFSAEDYWKMYEPLRGDCLRLGVELGLTLDAKEQNLAFMGRAPFDFVIGSIHLLDGADIYYPDVYEGRKKREYYHAYFAAMEQNLRLHGYIHVLGHIDYIARYATFEDPELRYDEFHEEIDAVLRAAIETDTVMELNTRRLGKKSAQEALLDIYKRYHELGGRFVTIGSDAHSVEAVGAHYAVARDMAEACGLRIVAFQQGKMELA